MTDSEDALFDFIAVVAVGICLIGVEFMSAVLFVQSAGAGNLWGAAAFAAIYAVATWMDRRIAPYARECTSNLKNLQRPTK